MTGIISRKLAGLRDHWKRYRKQRARTERRRQRVVDWEESIGRGSRRRRAADARAQTKRARRGCAFCEATRDWLAALRARLALAGASIGRGVAGLARRVGRSLPIEETDAGGTESCRTFRRRRYPGSRNRRFELHLPRGRSGAAPMPLLMVLHGCRQSSADIRSISNFDAIADREGFMVVYPFVTAYSGMRMRNCWGWWIDGEIRPGAGEVEDLWQIVEQVSAENSVDARRIHIAGLSSGGGMAVAAMVAHAGKFASGAAVAAVAYSETPRAIANGARSGGEFKSTQQVVGAMRSVMGEHRRPGPIFVVHSCDDSIVDIQAARNLRDSWAACLGIDATRPASDASGTTGGAPWVHAKYRQARKRSAIETLFIEGRGHGWYGGNPGNFSYPAAPDTSQLMWRFFKRHPLPSRASAAAQRYG